MLCLQRNPPSKLLPPTHNAIGKNDMNLLATLIIAVLALACLSDKLKQLKREDLHSEWLGLPDLCKYKEHYQPNHNSRNGSTCCYCGSRSIRHFGLVARNDQRRIHTCNHCNANLYRTYRQSTSTNTHL